MHIEIDDIDRGWNEIEKQIKTFEKIYAKVGVLSDAGEYDEFGHTTLADVATWNEYGTSKIPARPFMGQTADRYKGQANDQVDKGLTEVIEKKGQAMNVLKAIAVWYKGRVQKMFTDGDFAANAPSTQRIKTKKSGGKGPGRPLIDTGRLRASINFDIETT